MHEKPGRFRFGLISLLALVAVAGVVAILWNPFDRGPSISNIPLVKTGMTIDEVAELVGEPNYIGTLNGFRIHLYQDDHNQQWLIGFNSGKVSASEHVNGSPPP
jgi:hypothetical protein